MQEYYSKLSCGGKKLITNKLERVSEWLLDNIGGLREFEVTVILHSQDLGCDMERRCDTAEKTEMGIF